MSADLEAIVARDAAWKLDNLTHYAAEDDRRALLVILRQARDLIRSVNACHGCLDNTGSEAELALFAALSALPSPTATEVAP